MKNIQLQEVLSAKGVSMEELAKMLGTTYDEICMIATGTKEVTDKEIGWIADALGVPASTLFDDEYTKL